MYCFCKWTRITLLNWFMGVWFFLYVVDIFWWIIYMVNLFLIVRNFLWKDYKIPIRLTSLDHSFISQLLHDNGWFFAFILEPVLSMVMQHVILPVILHVPRKIPILYRCIKNAEDDIWILGFGNKLGEQCGKL